MLIVLPISSSDRNLISQTERAFEIFPPGSGHSLLVAGSPEMQEEITRLTQSLAQYFAGGSTDYFILDNDNNQGWPTACNYYFQSVAFHMPSLLAPGESWLWYELDTTPVRSNWMDSISEAVSVAQQAAMHDNTVVPLYFGNRAKTYLELGGRPMPADEAGFQMGQVGVYPSDMSMRVVTLPTVTATNVPWYTFCRWYIAYDLFHELPLVQNNWRTANYERTGDGSIKCASRANWAWDVHFNKDVNPEAVLVHGCKDGSLFELLAAEHDLVKEEDEKEPQAYWTDPEPIVEQPATVTAMNPEPVIKQRKRNVSEDTIRKARERLMEMHRKRKEAKLSEMNA